MLQPASGKLLKFSKEGLKGPKAYVFIVLAMKSFGGVNVDIVVVVVSCLFH